MDRPLTAREAKIVRDNPQFGWPRDTMAEAQERCFLADFRKDHTADRDPRPREAAMTEVRTMTDPDMRFQKFPNGQIIDSLTGTCIAAVDVQSLDTESADRVSNIIIAAPHREFGPSDTQGGAA